MIEPEDIEVPERLLTESQRLFRSSTTSATFQQCFLAVLANNPIVPTKAEAEELHASWSKKGFPAAGIYTVFVCTEWQRRMFLRKRNPELDALLESAPRVARDAVLAAYELGKAEGK